MQPFNWGVAKEEIEEGTVRLTAAKDVSSETYGNFSSKEEQKKTPLKAFLGRQHVFAGNKSGSSFGKSSVATGC